MTLLDKTIRPIAGKNLRADKMPAAWVGVGHPNCGRFHRRECADAKGGGLKIVNFLRLTAN